VTAPFFTGLSSNETTMDTHHIGSPSNHTRHEIIGGAVPCVSSSLCEWRPWPPPPQNGYLATRSSTVLNTGTLEIGVRRLSRHVPPPLPPTAKPSLVLPSGGSNVSSLSNIYRKSALTKFSLYLSDGRLQFQWNAGSFTVTVAFELGTEPLWAGWNRLFQAVARTHLRILVSTVSKLPNSDSHSTGTRIAQSV
jgi:hypothetical protein